MTEASLASVAAPIDERGTRSRLGRRLLAHPTGLVSLIALAVVALVAIFADVLAPFDPNAPDLRAVLAPPGGEHLLGTDSAGRDVLSRLLLATRFSVGGALWSVLIAALIGVTTGLVAGYYQKWFETLSGWLAGILQALPGIVVLLAARAVLGPSMWMIMAVLGVILSPAFYRLVFAAVVHVRHELYVDAARVAGVGDASIIGRHIFSVIRAPIIIQAAILSGIAISVQSGIEFLGLGDQQTPTWGQMLNDAFLRMYQAPQLLFWPSVAIALTSIALVLFGNALRDELEGTGGAVRRRRRQTRAAVTTQAGTDATRAAQMIRHDEGASAAAPVLLSIRDLSVGYDQKDGGVKEVVHGISLDVHRGEVHGLIGESGSGKTQTAWSVLGLLPEGGRITGGSITFEGTEIGAGSTAAMRKLRGRRIAYVPQEPMSNLDPSFTIGSQLIEPMRIHLGISREQARTEALGLLSRVGIPDPARVLASYPHELSGGMAQRVLIAGAVSCRPDLVIADEPTTALDVTVQAEILDLLRDLREDLGVSVLLVTHNLGVVADLCDRVSVMRDGSIVESGRAAAIFADPRHPYTRALFDAILEDGAARGPLVAAERSTNAQGARS
ncbi:MAG: dipeptide/oligopeptide/nickel ABC transporter permease/ATP-binding protein [Microbacterium sp.]|nr:MAG: dipeptide/oligopeptide/nickel ABC transporter permease/ATP-binding protein [Microbacterium sp.]